LEVSLKIGFGRQKDSNKGKVIKSFNTTDAEYTEAITSGDETTKEPSMKIILSGPETGKRVFNILIFLQIYLSCLDSLIDTKATNIVTIDYLTKVDKMLHKNWVKIRNGLAKEITGLIERREEIQEAIHYTQHISCGMFYTPNTMARLKMPLSEGKLFVDDENLIRIARKTGNAPIYTGVKRVDNIGICL
jgi:hypothetical protein